MDIAKQIIDQRILKLIEENPQLFTENPEKNVSKAFLLLGVSAYLDIDFSAASQYITDGSYDGGIDAVYFVEGQDLQLNVVLFQSKYTRDLERDSNFPANAIEKAVSTVNSVFDPSSHVELNEKTRKKIDEIRSLILDGRIPYVTFVMLNNGLSWTSEGETYIHNHFKNQPQVKFVHFNHSDILNFINRNQPIDAQISLSGKAVQENFNYTRVVLGRVAVTEIFRLMKDFGDALLEKNIRRNLGKNAVNSGIIDTLLSDRKSQNFFFYNNGITFVCSKMSYNALQKEDWILKTSDLQIINGGQTCKTIYQTIRENPAKDFSNVFVLLRLYEISDDENIVQDITYATNSQNPVDLRDLKSNDQRQILLETSSADLGFLYKRKRDFSTNANAIPASVAAEAALAIWRDKPYIARYRRNDLFDSFYEDIFNNLNAAQMIIAVLIFRFCDAMRKKDSPNREISSVRPFECHFVANIVGKILLKENSLAVDELTHKNFQSIKSAFENNKETYFNTAEALLQEMLRDYFGNKPMESLDGRTLAAPFRRFDLMENYIKNPSWTASHPFVARAE